MKKFKLLLFIPLFFIIFSVKSATLSNFIVISDDYDLKNEDTVNLSIRMNSNVSVTDSIYYYVEFNNDTFSFVSFKGNDYVNFDSLNKRIYFSKNINLTSNDIIGVLTLKVKKNAVDSKKIISIPYYEFDQSKGNVDYLDLSISPKEKVTIIATEDSNNDTSIKTDYTPYIIGGIIGLAAVSLLTILIYALKK